MAPNKLGLLRFAWATDGHTTRRYQQPAQRVTHP
jgi:hypothetical protein